MWPCRWGAEVQRREAVRGRGEVKELWVAWAAQVDTKVTQDDGRTQDAKGTSEPGAWVFNEWRRTNKCCVTTISVAVKTTHLLPHSFFGPEVWVQVNWVFCSGFHEAAVDVLARAMFSSEALGSLPTDSYCWQSSVSWGIGPRSSFSCWPSAKDCSQLLDTSYSSMPHGPFTGSLTW